jgi:hypothetical protein
MFTFALPAGLLPFVFPFMICSETPKATTFELYDGVSVIWTKHFLECKSFVSFHCFIPHFPKPLHGYNSWKNMQVLVLLSDDVGIILSYFD